MADFDNTNTQDDDVITKTTGSLDEAAAASLRISELAPHTTDAYAAGNAADDFADLGDFGGLDDLGDIGDLGNIGDFDGVGDGVTDDNVSDYNPDDADGTDDADDTDDPFAEFIIKDEVADDGDSTADIRDSADTTAPAAPPPAEFTDISGGYSAVAIQQPRPVLAHVYEMISEVGKGRGGIVYKARNTRIDKIVAIKKVSAAAKKVRDNKDEAMLLRDIEHSYLPRVYDYFVEDGESYTVTNFIEGENLTKYLKKHAVPPYKTVLKMALQLTAAVRYLHTKHPAIIHNDIKPDNIMIQPNDNICLIDFNASSVFVDDARAIGATRGYSAPELFGLYLKDDPTGAHSGKANKANKARAKADVKAAKLALAAKSKAGKAGNHKSVGGTVNPLMPTTDPRTPRYGTVVPEDGTGAGSAGDEQTADLPAPVFVPAPASTPASAPERTHTELLQSSLKVGNFNPNFIFDKNAVNAGVGNAGVSNAGVSNAGVGNAGVGNAGVGNAGRAGTPPNVPDMFHKGEHRFDPRSDVYSIGAIIYRLVTGASPAAEYDKIIPIAAYKTVKKPLRDIITKAISLRPSERYQTADELLSALITIDKQSRSDGGSVRGGFIAAVLAGLVIGVAGYGSYRYFSLYYSNQHSQLERDYDAAVTEASRLAAEGDYDGAEAEAVRAVKLFPNRTDARLLQVDILYNAGRLESCIEAVNRVSADTLLSAGGAGTENLFSIYSLGGTAAFDTENFTAAAKFYEEALRVVGDTTSPALNEGFDIVSTGRFECYLNLAISYARAGRAADATTLLDRVVEVVDAAYNTADTADITDTTVADTTEAATTATTAATTAEPTTEPEPTTAESTTAEPATAETTVMPEEQQPITEPPLTTATETTTTEAAPTAEATTVTTTTATTTEAAVTAEPEPAVSDHAYVELCIRLARGEIALSKQDVKTAEADAKVVLAHSADGYLTYRGILLFDRVMRTEPHGKVSYKNATDIIEKHIGKVPDKYRVVANSILADEYALRGFAYNNNVKCYRTAAALYKTAFDNARLQRNAMLNYVEMEYRLKAYDECLSTIAALDKLVTDDYGVPMYRSRVLFAKFEKDGSLADRNNALEAYDKAERLYIKYKNSGRTDPLMDELTASVSQYRVIDSTTPPPPAEPDVTEAVPELTQAPHPTGVPAPPPGGSGDPQATATDVHTV